MLGDKFTPEPVGSNSLRRHDRAPSAPMMSAAIAVMQMMAINEPEPFLSLEMSAVST